MPHADPVMRAAYAREYHRKRRENPSYVARELELERIRYAKAGDAERERRRAKNARYRERHRVELRARENARREELKAKDPAGYAEFIRARSKQFRARHREEAAFKAANLRRLHAWRERVKDTPQFRAKNVARATKWKRELDLHAPENIQRRIALRLRNRLKKALHRGPKTASAVRDMGCSVAELMAHLEAQFQSGMTWSNYGKWHIDHIRPLASFDLTDPSQARSACHFTNLQPLWARDNQKKSWKYPVALAA